MYKLFLWTMKKWLQPSFDEMLIMKETFINNGDKVNYIFIRLSYLNDYIPDKELRIDFDGRCPMDDVNGMFWLNLL